MSTLTIPTRAFIGLLSDVIRTAGDDPELPALSTVLLHSDRGDWAITDGVFVPDIQAGAGGESP